MIVIPGLPHEVQGLKLVNPAEQLVQLGWDQELPRDATRRFISKPVLCIRIGFSAEADPTFYLNADPNTESQNNALHPDPGQTLPLIEEEFSNEKYTYNVRDTVR
jgi:hypothetical protein